MDLIYIPLCFYFISGRQPAGRLVTHIYIPLCFYFIVLGINDSGKVEPNLHSTMLLLYHRSIDDVYDALHHLHSTMLLLYPNMRYEVSVLHNDLHSTMLLLYHIDREQKNLSFLFTFHYASTLSNRGKRVGDCYNHIYIPLCFYFILSKLAALSGLSSIYIPLCFYFILSCDQYDSANYSIYIPLCFYFI